MLNIICSLSIIRLNFKYVEIYIMDEEDVKVNKSDLVKAMAQKTGKTQKDAAKSVEAVIKAVEDALASGEKVQLIGFGSFEVRDRKARKVISPADGKELLVPATKVPAFKPGKDLKEAVANNKKKPAKKKAAKK